MEPLRNFRAPKRSFDGLDAEGAGALLTAASDIALVLDGKGVIRDMALGLDDFTREGYGAWIGQSWADTVTADSRPKIEALLRDAVSSNAPRWRQVNHPSAGGTDVPILYSAISVGRKGRLVAVGRDLRSVAVLQQQLVLAQQSMDRDYSRLRQMETRYRLLFQIASEAVLIVDARTQKVVEANPAAATLLGGAQERQPQLVGAPFPQGFDAEGTAALERMLASARAAGRVEDVRVARDDGRRQFLVSASLFRQESHEYVLVRLAPLVGESASSLVAATPTQRTLAEVVDRIPDGFVVTSPEGRLLTANRAFLDMVQLATEEQVRDESLERWLGRPGVDLGVLMGNLREHGAVRLFSTTLRGEYGYVTEVEISAVAVTGGEQPCLGFTIRNVGRRLAQEPRSSRQLPRSVEQLTKLIGRVSLKELVREATDVIERLCIEAALELTRDNRANAAEVLGLSRQSLYVKLRRYGLGDLDGGDQGS